MEYSQLAELYDSVAATSKRLEKTALIAAFLKDTPVDELERVILLLQGRVFAHWDKRVLGLSEKLVVKAISTASGASEQKIIDEWRTIGDIGKVAEKLIAKKTQSTLFSEDLSVKGVFETLQKIATLEGHGSTGVKVKLIAQMLSSAKGVEVCYIVRTTIGDLRVGIADGTLRDAIFYAFLVPEWEYEAEKNSIIPEAATLKDEMAILQSALDKANDFGTVAVMAKQDGLKGLRGVRITVGKPLKVMLAQKVADVNEGFARVGTPCALEYKYDGFRMQVHKHAEGITLFTRRLEDVTTQFPDVVAAVDKHVRGESFIIDAEAVGYDPATGKYRPFQDISQRIRRKYDIEKLAEKLPVELNVFDVLSYEGKDLLRTPFEERRQLIEKIVEGKEQELTLSEFIVTDSPDEAEQFYKHSLDAGNEGIMLKKLDAPYQPGSRVGTMIKLKPVLDTFDLVIVEAEWGTGKRSGWLTSYTVACYDDSTDEFLTVGKFGTGIKEKEEAVSGDDITFEQITEVLKPHIIAETGRDVVIKPNVVVEVKFEEVQKSPTYESGYALRFPRFVKLREDRGIDDMTTLSMVEMAYTQQRGRG